MSLAIVSKPGFWSMTDLPDGDTEGEALAGYATPGLSKVFIVGDEGRSLWGMWPTAEAEKRADWFGRTGGRARAIVVPCGKEGDA